jgi:RHS repeat-associated protein
VYVTATQISLAVTYTYSAAGQLTNITYPSGRKLTLTYPPQSDLVNAISLAKDATAAATPLIRNIVWEPFGPPSAWDWNLTAGPQKYERIYDLAGRITRLRIGNAIRDISYDAASRISAYTHYDATTSAPQPALNQSFGYDALGRITSVSANASSWSFAYDANGNRTSVTQNGVASSYATEATSNKLTTTTNPANSVAYDAAGNTITTSQYSATYDLSGRMATLSKGGITTTYSYNNAGQRIRKFSSTGATSTVLFVYGQDGNLLGEYDSTGKPIKEYVWFQNIPVAVFTPDPSAAVNPPLIYFIHADHLNTPRAVVDKANKLRWRWLAEPFGVSTPETNPSNLGAFTFNLRFPGQYFDQESALHQNWWRSYDPTTGRYTQSDPIGLAGGINTFAYVENQPTMLIDPRGLQASCAAPANAVVCAEAGIGGAGAGAAAITVVRLQQLVRAAIQAAAAAAAQDNDRCNDRCKQAKEDAAQSFQILTGRMLDYLTGGARGPDSGHLKAIKQFQSNLREALGRVERHCNPLPPQYPFWREIADVNIPKLF